jgi:hypothetical protein
MKTLIGAFLKSLIGVFLKSLIGIFNDQFCFTFGEVLSELVETRWKYFLVHPS